MTSLGSFPEYARDLAMVKCLLSRDEEQRLARLAKQGDKAARDKLVHSQLAWGVRIAVQMSKLGFSDLDDLIQVANLTILKCVDAFDPERGLRLSTYVGNSVKRDCREFSHQHSSVARLPSYVVATPNNKQRMNDLRARLTCDATSIQLMALGEFDPATLVEENEDRNDAARIIAAAVKQLRGNYRAVIVGRMRGETLDALGRRFGLSKERIRQIETKAYKMLRNVITGSGLKPREMAA